MKAPTKPQLATLGRIEKLGYLKPAQNEKRTNPFSGISHTLEPLACQLYDFVTTRHHTCGLDYTRADWDRARYWFLANWPREYYDLLD
jgi:hypothetical protein